MNGNNEKVPSLFQRFIRRKIPIVSKVLFSFIGFVMIFMGFFLFLASQYGMTIWGSIAIPLDERIWVLLIGWLLIIFGIVLMGYVIFSDFDPDAISRIDMQETESRREVRLNRPSKEEVKSKAGRTKVCRSCGAINEKTAAICVSCLSPFLTRDELESRRRSIEESLAKEVQRNRTINFGLSISLFSLFLLNLQIMIWFILFHLSLPYYQRDLVFSEFSSLQDCWNAILALSFLFLMVWVFFSKPKYRLSLPLFVLWICTSLVGLYFDSLYRQ